VQDINVDSATAFRQELRTRQGFDVDLANHALSGVCAECALRACA
jgi:hypothetical protein